MLTKEYIQNVEELGYKVTEGRFEISVRDILERECLTVGKNAVYSVCTNDYLTPPYPDNVPELMEITFQYIKTPTEERE